MKSFTLQVNKITYSLLLKMKEIIVRLNLFLAKYSAWISMLKKRKVASQGQNSVLYN